jgi:hypothetical protein
MATFREAILAGVVDPLRYLPDVAFDIRTFKVSLVRREWQPLGDNPPEIDLGTPVDTVVVLQPRPKVRELGGVSSNGQFQITRITPKNTSGGYLPEELNPAPVDGVEFFWRLEGPFATGLPVQDFAVVSLDTSKPFSYTVTLQPYERRKVT